MNTKIAREQLTRRAIVYVRQSTVIQLIENKESQRRQFGLADHARQLGFAVVEMISEDLGRSGSGLVERPGFQRLVSEVCTGEVGAVFCIEASRLARNGRDWHHLLELCGLVGTLIVDPDGVYDPRLSDDRLLLGLKGTLSEFELTLLRQRSMEAIRSKAKRGELKFLLPVGLCWTQAGKIEKVPDRRIQQAIELVFAKFHEMGSARQVLLWLRSEAVSLPRIVNDRFGPQIAWKLPIYNNVLTVLKNPLYAGAYAFGKTEAQVTLRDGRGRKTHGHYKAQEDWSVLLRDHHEGYISWEQYERNKMVLGENTHMKKKMGRKAGRGGRSLLAGLLRCGRCGRMLHVAYSGAKGDVPRYHCRGAHINHGTGWCLSFGGLRPDRAVAEEVLRAVDRHAVEAALVAAEKVALERDERRQAVVLELEQARYESQLAERRYEAVDPAQRLVAAELEARWNVALQRARDVEKRLEECSSRSSAAGTHPLDREALLRLAQDLAAVWQSPSTEMRHKQRIVHILIEEIIANIDEEKHEIMLMIHWRGGRHTPLRFTRVKSGHHRRCTEVEAVEVVKRMAGHYRDEQIAATLNRLGLRTGAGNTWHEARVCSLRHHLGLPIYHPDQQDHSRVTLEEAAARLGISVRAVRRMIENNILPAKQTIKFAPWEIAVEVLEDEAVQQAVRRIKAGPGGPRTGCQEEERSMFIDIS